MTHHNSCDYPAPHQVRPIRPTRRSVSGRFAFRGVVSVPFESTLERDFLVRAEFFTNVQRVISQPVAVPFTLPDGRSYTYTPDFLVYRTDRSPELVEVKPAEQWRKHARRWFPKWKAARRLAHERGWRFLIHDESRIRDRPLDNIRFLQRYARVQCPPEACERLVAALESAGPMAMHDLLDRSGDPVTLRLTRTHLWHLLATRRIDADITDALDDTTELRIAINGR